jgi:predicted nucleotidyltransferase
MSIVISNVPSILSLDAIRAAIRPVCENSQVSRIDLFGSAARGDVHPESDVDLMVEFLPDSQVGLFEMGALKEDLEDQLGCQVDLVSRRAVEQSRNPFRRSAILTNAVPVYVR